MGLIPKLKMVAASLKRELSVYRLVLKDPRTPRIPKILLWLAVGYLLLPFDFIPDWIPIIGHLDDVVIVPLLILVAFRFIPKAVIDESRQKVRGSGSPPIPDDRPFLR
jgi:uncharacterized membrane protein YkvA (DUF1232 family)